MNKYNFGELTRVSKATARRLWGVRDMLLCPSNLRPGRPWHPELRVDAQHIAASIRNDPRNERNPATFDRYVANYEWHNCTCKETSYYTAFYLIGPISQPTIEANPTIGKVVTETN